VCGAVSPALVYLEKFTSLSDQLIRLSTKYKIQAAQEKLRFIAKLGGPIVCYLNKCTIKSIDSKDSIKARYLQF